jgi:hypothetical protein
VDPTANRPTGTSTDATYPAGPYGYAMGSVIEDTKFLGKTDPGGAAGTADYSGLPMKEVWLHDYHDDPNVKLLVLSGVAGWCRPCNDEQDGFSPEGRITSVPAMQAKYEPMGVRFFEAMIQGFDFQSAAPAMESDINRWAGEHSLHVGIGLDSEDKIHEYADVSAFPLNMVISTRDMKIVFMQTGETDMDPEIAGLVNAPSPAVP